MQENYAVHVRLSEARECGCCREFAQEGFVIRTSSSTRFVCVDCYDRMRGEYPLVSRSVEISEDALKDLIPEVGTPGFGAGYLLGKRENTDDGFRISVSRLIPCCGQEGRATAAYFSGKDVLTLRQVRSSDLELVGIYRTSPSGKAEINELDRKTIDDITLDLVYVVIGGRNDMSISAAYSKSGEQISVTVCR